MREKRKIDHLQYSLDTAPGPLKNGFSDIYLIHQALSSLAISEIDCTKKICDKILRYPLIINAMTGGAEGLEKINRKLSIVSKECNIGLAVGSQTAGAINKSIKHTYEVVRKANPDGLIFGNVSALADPNIALQAVEMIEADALQLHLNIAQELAMSEGDRDFKNILENILKIKEIIKVPIIIKEVGFGLSAETVQILKEIGIKYVDVGGAGGTNFVSIEKRRNKDFTNNDLIFWGIPSAISLLEALSVSDNIRVFASGGIKTAGEIVKSIALGATCVGMATPFLQIIHKKSERDLIEYINGLFANVKQLMLLLGAENLEKLKSSPVVITGFTREWLDQRGIETNKYARR